MDTKIAATAQRILILVLFCLLVCAYTGESDATTGITSVELTGDSIPNGKPDTIVSLDKMTVAGKRSTGSDKTTIPSVVQGDNLRESVRSTPLEELSQKSGDIYVTSRGTGLHGVASGASGGVYIRGLGGSPNSQIIIVEDGAPDYQGIFGHPIPDAIFPALIDRVIVIKGGDGVLYGGNAMGGVILIENRWPDSLGLHLENETSYGSFNTFRERVTLLYGGKGVDIASAFSAFSTDGHRDWSGGNCIAGQLGARLHLPGAAAITLRNKVLNLEGTDPGPVATPNIDHTFKVLRNNASLRLDYPGNVINTKIVSWFDVGEHRLYDGFYSLDYTSGASVECTIELLGDRLNILIGVAGEHVDGDVYNRIDTLGIEHAKSTDTLVESSSTAGAYGQVTLKPGYGFVGVCGGRVHYSTRYGIVPLYKAGLKWEPGKSFDLHTRLIKNFRQPTLRELYLPFPVANDTLLPETAYNWDAGFEVNTGMFRLSSTFFRTLATQMIKYFGSYPVASIENIGRLEVWGVEGEVSIEQIGPVNLFLTGCWQDAGRFTKQNPEAKVNGRIGYKKLLEKGMLEISLSGEWVHGLYMENYKADEDRMNDVYFLDGSIRFRTQNKAGVSIEPYGIIRNLLNSEYEYIKGYTMPGINILAGIIIKV